MFIGSPCIFYGTEICLSGGYDPDCRQNFDWGNLDKTENFRIKFKKIISLKKLKQLIDGEIKIYETDNLFVIERKYEDKTISLYINEYTKKIRINESGKELISNNYKNGILDINGFIVIEN
jgi:glycosidase